MREQRLNDIEQYLSEKQMCSLDHLCEVFGVSKITIRRDIQILCDENIAIKVYGGIKYNNKEIAPLIPYIQRKTKNDSEKEYIGKLASNLVREADTIYLDSGTTTPKVLKYIENKRINILTNNLTITVDSLEYQNIKLLSTGGELNPITKSFIGDKVLESIDSYNTSIAFLAATGYSIKSSFTNSDCSETKIKKVAINKAAKTYVLIDSSKWDTISLTTFANVKDINGIITDKVPPIEYKKHFIKMNIELIY